VIILKINETSCHIVEEGSYVKEAKSQIIDWMVQIIRRNRMSLLYGELQCPIVEIVLNPYRNQKF
jgi:hypothetical protein